MQRAGTMVMLRVVLLGMLVFGLAACAAKPPIDPILGAKLSAEPPPPLGGASLAKARDELRRAERELVHFQKTLVSLRQRSDVDGHNRFRRTVWEHLVQQVDPLLARAWPSEHLELAALDAQLRLMKVEVLLQMGHPLLCQRAINDIRRRFPDTNRILVTAPTAGDATLEEALMAVQLRRYEYPILRKSRRTGAVKGRT